MIRLKYDSEHWEVFVVDTCIYVCTPVYKHIIFWFFIYRIKDVGQTMASKYREIYHR